jgi:small subunit ribosomal protein S6
MNERTYESAVLINAALEDDQVESILSKIQETITSGGGNIREIENWGRKRLAYVVKKNKIGYYAIFRFDAPPNLVSRLERQYQLDENILRYINLKLSGDALAQIEKDKKEVSEIVEIEERIPTPDNSAEELTEDDSEKK